MHETLKDRHQDALDELTKLIQDKNDFPINYNHYYTDTVHKKRQERIKTELLKHVPEDTHSPIQRCSAGNHYPYIDVKQEVDQVVRRWAETATPDMEYFSIQEALDCLMAIYKVSTTPSCLETFEGSFTDT